MWDYCGTRDGQPPIHVDLVLVDDKVTFSTDSFRFKETVLMFPTCFPSLCQQSLFKRMECTL
jgi:hypothetical protein